MLWYYISTDLRDSKICIAPYKVSERPYLIEFDSLWEAENHLKKLNFNDFPSPEESSDDYILSSTVSLEIGEVDIYQLVKKEGESI